MLDKYYSSLNSKIEPSEDLIMQTKSKMYLELNKKSTSVPKIKYKLGIIAACFTLIIGVLFTPLLKSKLTENQNMQTGLENDKGNNSGNNKDDSWYSGDKENNLNIGKNEENNPVDNIESDSDVNSLEGNTKEIKGTIKQLSQREAYLLEGYGQLLPKSILQGYKFESASIYNSDTTGKKLRFNYTSGYNYIEITVRGLQSEDEGRMVKASEIKKFDITKYTIPFANSIPRSLRDTMDNPIFQAGELTEEILSYRKYISHEQGDKGGECMRFAIQCGEYLIEYNIKGNSLDGVFDMITSSDYFINEHNKE